MKAATKRAILRWVHLIFVIPVLGYIYQPADQVQQYVGGARFIFVPVLMFTGYYMYAGLLFAAITVAAWLTCFQFLGFGPALLSQLLLLIGRKVFLAIRARPAKNVPSEVHP